jgi:hypothetical protein
VIELMAGGASDRIAARATLTVEGTAAGSQSPASLAVESRLDRER